MPVSPILHYTTITAWESCEEARESYDNLAARFLEKELPLSQKEETKSDFTGLLICKPRTDHRGIDNNTKIKKKAVEFFICH